MSEGLSIWHRRSRLLLGSVLDGGDKGLEGRDGVAEYTENQLAFLRHWWSSVACDGGADLRGKPMGEGSGVGGRQSSILNAVCLPTHRLLILGQQGSTPRPQQHTISRMERQAKRLPTANAGKRTVCHSTKGILSPPSPSPTPLPPDLLVRVQPDAKSKRQRAKGKVPTQRPP